MLYDRQYMRSDEGRREPAPMTWIFVATIGGFVLQAILTVWFGQWLFLRENVALSLAAIKHGYIWTLVTYGFIHGSLQGGGILHIAVNLLALYMFGREVAPRLGARRFGGFYVGALVAAALLPLAIELATGPRAPVVGASGAVFGVFALWALLVPDQPRTILLFFLIPVTFRPKILLAVSAAVTAFLMFFVEIPGFQPVAHSCHLGGMIAGCLYYYLLMDRQGRPISSGERVGIELPAWMRKKKSVRAGAASSTYKVNVSTPPQDMKAEVDRILDKINSEGFGALTVEERRILDQAGDSLNRR